MGGKEELQKKILESNDPIERMGTASYAVYGFLRGLLEEEKIKNTPETLFAALGSLAGFSCVLDIVYKLGQGKVELKQPDVVLIETTAGELFYSGNLINGKLAEDEVSVFSLAAGGLEALGCPEAVKDVELGDIFKRTAETLGSDDFGVPKLPKKLKLPLPKELLVKHFSFFHSVLSTHLSLPLEEYYGAFAIAAQAAMEDYQKELRPQDALKIFMEYAVPMAKVNPEGILRE